MKPQISSPQTWKAERDCSEETVRDLARQLAEKLRTRLTQGGKAILCLEGELGAGKSTFAKYFLAALDSADKTAGSPTFAIVQSYIISPVLQAHHADLYRLKSEAEIFETGIESMVWGDPGARAEIILLEWTSMWPGFFAELHARRGFPAVWQGLDVNLKHSLENPELTRDVEILVW